MLVEKKRTVLSRDDLVLALHGGHLEALEAEPPATRLAMAAAQVCLETGNGLKMWNNNFGNITCKPSDEIPYFQLTTREGEHEDASRTHVATLCYRAYEHPAEGAAAYWHLLAHRYAPALARFDEGAPALAAKALRQLGYYTAPEETYAVALAALYHDCQRLVARLVPLLPEGSA